MSTTAIALLCLAVLGTGCASSADDPAAEDAPTAESGTTASPAPDPSASASPDAKPPVVYEALCDAAAATDPDAAESAFGRAHEGLHTLARELQQDDQAVVAGDLLEAKHGVEAAFGEGPAPDDLDQRLDRLLVATADAIAASGQARPTCPAGTSP